MDSCRDATSALVALHFGTIDSLERDAIEAHLIECPSCVRDYLALKRAVEMPDETEAPSEASRAKLQRSIARELTRARAGWRWWERPVATVLAAASVILGLRVVQTIAASEGRAPHSVDRAGPSR